MRWLQVNPLSREAFLPFGEVIATEGVQPLIINAGKTQRFHALARTECLGQEATVVINLFRSQPYPFPVALSVLERHPLGSQAFFPLQHRPYLVVVAPDRNLDQPDIEKMTVFLAQGNQGVSYRKGTWHHPLLALEQETDFLVIDREGPGENCDVFQLPESLFVAAVPT